MTTTTNPRKVSEYKGQCTYRYGIWLIYTERRTHRTYACGMSRSTSSSTWHAHTTEGESRMISGCGGVKKAVEKISKI